ncbi:RxLR effector protein [Phytophthora megakarya]|uniref:RxLR effector protein n=1 Tax=Phytophthora megakarya TaxID=4795 RepID=A0A225VX00_9STRA|nr:RxLR effector protein [Phytophthora megakarya]
MHLTPRAMILVASIALLGNIDTTSGAMDVEQSNVIPSNPSLRVHTLVGTTNQDGAKRTLRQKMEALGEDHALHEERGWLSKLLGYKLNLNTISDEGIATIMENPEAKAKAFQYLHKKKVDSQMVYVRLGGPNISSTKEKFWKAYGPYYDARTYVNY